MRRPGETIGKNIHRLAVMLTSGAYPTKEIAAGAGSSLLRLLRNVVLYVFGLTIMLLCLWVPIGLLGYSVFLFLRDGGWTWVTLAWLTDYRVQSAEWLGFAAVANYVIADLWLGVVSFAAGTLEIAIGAYIAREFWPRR